MTPKESKTSDIEYGENLAYDLQRIRELESSSNPTEKETRKYHSLTKTRIFSLSDVMALYSYLIVETKALKSYSKALRNHCLDALDGKSVDFDEHEIEKNPVYRLIIEYERLRARDEALGEETLELKSVEREAMRTDILMALEDHCKSRDVYETLKTIINQV